MNRPTFAILTILLAQPAGIRAEDWPEFRGPTGQGIVRQGGAPLEWGPSKNVVWKQTIPGKGWSSPVVVAGRVYLTAAVPSKAAPEGELALEALCLDSASGKVLWEKEVFHQPATAPRIHTKNSHASPTPLVYDGRVYVHFGHGGTACLDTEGKVLWMNTELRYAPVHGNGGSPILVEDRLIFSCDGSSNPFVVALNKDTGRVIWKTLRSVNAVKKFSFHTPLLITVNDQKQVISAGSEAVCAYDPANGKEIWKVRTSGYSVIPRPVYGHGLVYICTGYDSPTLLAIRPDGKGDVTETHVAWKVTRNVPHTASLLLGAEELFMVSDRGNVSCLEAKTGKVIWTDRLAGQNFSASPVLVDGKIYLQSEDGVGTVLQAGRAFEQLARNPLDERALASFAVVNGALFVRTEKHLYRFEAR
jgi:outer membrane protein assembly factor BamB